MPVTRRALVIGGGVAGIQAALDIADAGYPVVLVEREPSIGGKMAGLSETFPTLDCSQCILTPRMVDVAQHPNITLHTYSEVESVEGYVGNFRVTIRKKARYIDMERCTGCGECWNVCPSQEESQRVRLRLGQRTAIYVPFPQAVPARPVIDSQACLKLKKGRCGLCEKKCQAGAIKFDDQDQLVEEEVGAVVVATGYQLYDIGPRDNGSKWDGYGEYGYGRYPDVIDSLQFERLASASGPTGGKIQRPSDGREPKSVVFISCVGSRDNAKGISYCSKICCMVQREAHDALQAQGARRCGARVLHGHSRRRQELRRVRAPRDRTGRRPVPSRASFADHRGGRPADRARRRYAGRCAADDRGRHGRAGFRHGPGRRCRNGWPRSSMSDTTSSASCRNRIPSCGRWRPMPRGSSCAVPAKVRKTFPESVAQAIGGGRQGAGDVRPGPAHAGAGSRPCERSHLRRLPRLPAGLPLQGDPEQGRDEPRRTGDPPCRRASTPACAWAAGRAWPSAVRRARTWTVSPNNKSTPWWRAWHEQHSRSSRRSLPTSATGARTWVPTWREPIGWSIRPTCASCDCRARGASTST